MKRVPRSSTLDLVRLALLGLAMLPCTGVSVVIFGKRPEQRTTPMHKAQFTQKGYIQFLRWELFVPEITEFTFCLWLQSNDLTHPHSIFSYSRNETERLARSWISAHGRYAHLEIGGKRIFSVAADIRENRWYHLCASWENQLGRYGLWINGRLWAEGLSTQTVGHRIPRGGDPVLGQEYTDFDKGLEDGIEGSVVGFNLLLASAFDPPGKSRQPDVRDFAQPPPGSSYARLPFFARTLTQRGTDRGLRTGMRTTAFLPISFRARGRRDAVDGRPTRRARNVDFWLDRGPTRLPELAKEPLGLQLAKLSYARCEIGRGSPFVGGPLMLIAWSRTPVRVFGGATLKNVRSDCGNF